MLCFLGAAIGGELLKIELRWPAFIILGCVIGYFFYVLLNGVKCPNCGANVLCLFYAPQWRPWLSLPKNFGFCPGCGISFNSEIKQVKLHDNRVRTKLMPKLID